MKNVENHCYKPTGERIESVDISLSLTHIHTHTRKRMNKLDPNILVAMSRKS